MLSASVTTIIRDAVVGKNEHVKAARGGTPPSNETQTKASASLAEATKVRGGIVLAGSAASLTAATLLLLMQEMITVAAIVFAIVGLVGLGWSLNRRRRRVWLLVAADFSLILLYTWSLGNSIPIVVYGNSSGYTAVVDGQRFFQPAQHRIDQADSSNRIGLFAGGALTSQYVVTSNGIKVASGEPILSGLANDARFAVPRPAWTDLRIRTRGTNSSIKADQIEPAHGSWVSDPRDEIEGSLGAVGWIKGVRSSTFQLSGSLVRADGTQGILLGVHGRGYGYGYLLAVRLDHRDAKFYYWNNGVIGSCTCHAATVFPVGMIPMIQRTLQFALPSVILALLLGVTALVVYSLLAWGMTRLQASPSPKITRLNNQIKWRLLLDCVAGAVAAVGTASGLLIALNVNQTLPTIEDTSTYIFQAKTYALGRLTAPIPHLPPHVLTHFFALSFTPVSHGHWFGKYPPGWPLLLALGALVGKPWVITPIVGGLSLFLIYLIGSQLHGRVVGLVAAVLALGSPFMLSMSSSLLSQSATWLWCGLFAYLMVVWVKNTDLSTLSWKIPRQNVSILIGAGVAVGLAFMTRQLDTITVTLPFVCCFARRPLAVVWIVAGSVPPLLFFAVYNFVVTGNATGSGYGAAFPWDRLGFGPNVGGPDIYESNFNVARGVWNLAYDLEHLQIGLFGWPFFFGLALVAIPFVLGRSNRWDWLLLASCGCVVGAYITYWASGVTGGLPRYWYAIVPWLAILAARGLEELYRWPLDVVHSIGGRRLVAAVMPAMLVIVMMVFNLSSFLGSNVLYYRNPTGAVVAAVDRAHLHDAVVFQVQHNAQQSEFETAFSQNSPLLNGNVLWAIDHGPLDVRVMRAFPRRTFYCLDGTSVTRMYPPKIGKGLPGIQCDSSKRRSKT